MYTAFSDHAAPWPTALLPANPWNPAPRSLHQAPRTRLFGLDLVKATRDHAAREIVTMAASGECATIQFVNAHCVNTMQTNPAYRTALACADLLLPDGSGMAIAARLAGEELGENLNGTDLFPEICRHAAARGQALFLLGGRPGIACAAAAAMRERFPGLRIAGTRHGFFGRHEERGVIEQINQSGAAIVLVGLGVPLQETWIAGVRARLNAPIVAGVGGLFDYYSGAIARAPAPLRAAGCEWLWRLMLEPRRMFGRYVLGNPRFLVRALAHAWSVRGLGERLAERAKRGFDIVAALAAITAALPLLLLVALAVLIEDRGPVFFAQTRIGDRGVPFRMWKFRSMVVDAEQRLAALQAQSERAGACFKMKHDPRITRVGRILRRLSLDELPQVFNILRGDMSIVGPRPALAREVLLYDRKASQRLGGRPGLTCTWQVSGRADIPFDRQVELDVEYLRNRTFLGDLRLIFRTVPAVLTARGAY